MDKSEELKEEIMNRLDESFNNYWHSTSDLIKESVVDDILKKIDKYAQQVSRKIAKRAFNEAGKLTLSGLKWEDFNDYWESEKYPDTDVRGDATENLPSNQEEQ